MCSFQPFNCFLMFVENFWSVNGRIWRIIYDSIAGGIRFESFTSISSIIIIKNSSNSSIYIPSKNISRWVLIFRRVCTVSTLSLAFDFISWTWLTNWLERRVKDEVSWGYDKALILSNSLLGVLNPRKTNKKFNFTTVKSVFVCLGQALPLSSLLT